MTHLAKRQVGTRGWQPGGASADVHDLARVESGPLGQQLEWPAVGPGGTGHTRPQTAHVDQVVAFGDARVVLPELVEQRHFRALDHRLDRPKRVVEIEANDCDLLHHRVPALRKA